MESASAAGVIIETIVIMVQNCEKTVGQKFLKRAFLLLYLCAF